MVHSHSFWLWWHGGHGGGGGHCEVLQLGGIEALTDGQVVIDG